MSALERIADIVESDFGSANPERLLSPKAVIQVVRIELFSMAANGHYRTYDLVQTTSPSIGYPR